MSDVIDPGITPKEEPAVEEPKPESGGEPKGQEPAGEPKQDQIPGWLNQGSEEHKSSEYYRQFKSAKDALNEFDRIRTEHEALQGKIPKVPETPEMYDITEYQVPEGWNVNQETENWFRQLAHENGLTQKQFLGLAAAYSDRMIDMFRQKQEALQNQAVDVENQLRDPKLFGADFDRRMDRVNDLLVELKPADMEDAEFLNEIESSEMGNNMLLIRILDNMAERFGEHIFVSGEQGAESNKDEWTYDSASMKELRNRAQGLG